jgi:hypothetical protein
MDHRVIKAVLLNSASKDGGEKPGEIRVTRKDGRLWSPAVPGTDSLDDQMGAGEVNAQAAFVQFNRPEATTRSPAPGTSITFSVDPIAWDFNHVYVDNFDQYDINQKLAAGTKLTATLIWDRHVTRTPCNTPDAYPQQTILSLRRCCRTLIWISMRMVFYSPPLTHWVEPASPIALSIA